MHALQSALLVGITTMILAIMPSAVFAAETEIELADGTLVQAEYGHITVPERRDRPKGGTITLPYVRILAEGERTGPPIIHLRGGPGHSGIELLDTDSLAMLVRNLAVGREVVLFDQRGTGDALPRLDCEPPAVLPLIPAPSREELFDAVSQLASNCAARMREQGIDLAGYNTNESADDIADLAENLGFDRVVLFGMSYGSQLGLTVIRRHGALVERAVLGLIVGPDDLFDRPHQFDDVLAKLDAIARQPESGWPHPEPPSLAVKQSLERLNQPQRASWTDDYDRKIDVEISRIDLERVFYAYFLGDEESWRTLPGVVKRLREGDFSRLARTVTRMRRLSFDPMRRAMRCASNASVERQALIEEELTTSIASVPPGFPYLDNICAALGVAPLPASFREPVVSDVPVLLISGELDGKTPPSNAEIVAKGLANVRHLRIAGISHNYADPLRKSRGLRDAVNEFLAGEEVPSSRYSIPFKFDYPEGSRS